MKLPARKTHRHLPSLLLATLCGAAAAQTTLPATPDDASLPLVAPRSDERRSLQPLTLPVFGRPTELRLGYELTLEKRKNFDLNSARDRDRRVRDQEFKAEARMRLSPRLSAMAEAVLVSEFREQPATGAKTNDHGFQRGQLWLLYEGLGGLPLSLQAGRIALVDRRAFWWEEDLDAVRLIANGDSWRVETGLGRELARKVGYDSGIKPENKGVWRWFGQASWTWQPRNRLEAFWLHANDRSGIPAPGSRMAADDADPSDARLSWLGLRASGRQALGKDLLRAEYWSDLAAVSGKETLTNFSTNADGSQLAGGSSGRKVRGHAIDLGLQLMASWPLRPTLTLGWAKGSGAGNSAAIDRNFRQTGLQQNKSRLAGVKRLHRYGELLDPELSNLRVGTLGAGLRLSDNTSVEAVWHRYHQIVPSTLLAGSRLSQAPAGSNGDIGRELDLFFAWRESPHVEVTFALSRFKPGAAFAANRRDAAHGVELGVALNY